jgi:hypothetical protein
MPVETGRGPDGRLPSAARASEHKPAPLKTLGKRHWATTSAASRWITEARHRGYLHEKGKKEASHAR